MAAELTPDVAAHRCRLCTTNDEEGLVEDLAEAFWNSQRGGMDDAPWPEAGNWWHIAFRNYARAAVALMRRNHASPGASYGDSA